MRFETSGKLKEIHLFINARRLEKIMRSEYVAFALEDSKALKRLEPSTRKKIAFYYGVQKQSSVQAEQLEKSCDEKSRH